MQWLSKHLAVFLFSFFSFIILSSYILMSYNNYRLLFLKRLLEVRAVLLTFFFLPHLLVRALHNRCSVNIC